MEVETIHGQTIAKSNHYMSVPGKSGERRIIKDEAIRAYERSFMEQCVKYRNRRISSRFRLFVRVWHSSVRFDLDNSLKTLLDCLQMAGAITDDKLCFQIEAESGKENRQISSPDRVRSAGGERAKTTILLTFKFISK